MKPILLLIICLGTFLHTQGQSISKEVIGSAGHAMNNGSYNLNFTVGEPVVGMIQNGMTIHQGFWAELVSDETLSVTTLLEEEASINIFPNPVISVLHITFKQHNAAQYNIQLYDSAGRQVYGLQPQSETNSTTINLSMLSDGIYLIHVSDTKSNYSKTFKIIKK